MIWRKVCAAPGLAQASGEDGGAGSTASGGSRGTGGNAHGPEDGKGPRNGNRSRDENGPEPPHAGDPERHGAQSSPPLPQRDLANDGARTFDSDAGREEQTAPPAGEETVAHEIKRYLNEHHTDQVPVMVVGNSKRPRGMIMIRTKAGRLDPQSIEIKDKEGAL